MAEDKQHKPTTQKLNKARKDGQIISSKELISFINLIVTIILLLIFKDYLANSLTLIMQQGLNLTYANIFNNDILLSFNLFRYFLIIIIPIVLIINLFIIGGHLILGGIIFKAPKFAFNKLNPLTGIKRIFDLNTIFELVKAIIKISLLFIVAYFIIKSNLNELINLNKLNYKLAIIQSLNLIINFCLYLVLSLILIVTLDIPWQILQYYKKLKMSTFELKQEYKENEGKPEIKAKIKRMQQDLATKRMFEAIALANVIINNPTHISVALQYTESKNTAPIVVAKGKDLVALQIRKIASKNKIVQVHSTKLARALFYSTDLNQPIPSALYLAVAKVLAYIYQVDQKLSSSLALEDVEVPKELIY